VLHKEHIRLIMTIVI